MPEDPCTLRLWAGLRTATDEQRALVKRLVHYAASLLDRVYETFPTYTLHNAEHARNVAENIANLLGDGIDKLLPIEAALLILAAYFHDIGMVFTDDERRGITSEPEWNDFLQQHPEAYVEYAKSPADSVSPAIAEWYCRWRHADRVYVALRDLSRNDSDALRWGVVNLFQILGELCRSHDKSVSDLQSNPELMIDGLDGADLRFCAILLRLGDILDFDGSRSPEPVYRYLGLARRDEPRKQRSDVEWLKHLSSGGVRFPTARGRRYELGFSAGPNHPAVEHDVRQFLSVIEQELDHCTALLSGCSPRWRDSDLPASIDRDNIKSDGYRYGEYRFTLDQDHVLRLLMGENLYSSPYVFVREILQNAIDATRLRTHLERSRGLVGFAPSPIRITEWTDPAQYRWVRFDDDGTGMDEQIVRAHLLRVGSSYYGSAQFKADMLRTKGGDFMPISRFGIGLLSCFIACDRIEISTLRQPPPGAPGTAIRLSLDGLQGFFVLRTKPLPAPEMPSDGSLPGVQEYRTTPGTSIACRLDPTKEQGEFRLAEILHRYLLAPPVPIEFEGARIGGDADALAMQTWLEPYRASLGAEPAAELTAKIGLPFGAESINVAVKSIDLGAYSPRPELQGGIVWASLEIAEELTDVLRDNPIGTPLRSILTAGYELPSSFYPTDYRMTFSFHANVSLNDSQYVRIPPADAAQAAWFEAARKLPASEQQKMRHMINLPRTPVPNPAAEALFKGRDRSFVMSHNGIAVPVSDQIRLEMPDGAAWAALLLTDSLRPELSISRDELRGLPWEIHSAVTLAIRRALAGEVVNSQRLSYLHPLRSLKVNDYLSLDRLLADPLLSSADAWQAERLFLVVGEQQHRTLADVLGRVQAGIEIALFPPGEHADIAQGSSAPARSVAAALACRFMELVLTGAFTKYSSGNIRVRGPRTQPLSPAELLFAPGAFMPFEGSPLLRGWGTSLNSNHDFTRWLIDRAPTLARHYPGILRAIRALLLEQPAYSFNPDKTVETLTGLLERVGRLAPELRLQRSRYPKRTDFPADA